jgi:hypothetical protein
MQEMLFALAVNTQWYERRKADAEEYRVESAAAGDIDSLFEAQVVVVIRGCSYRRTLVGRGRYRY